MTPQALPAGALSAEEMAERLTAGARLSDDRAAQAAAHLITFTNLPGRVDFAQHVDLQEQEDPSTGAAVPVAYVRDYVLLLAGVRMSGATEKLVTLAGALEEGNAVKLGRVFGDLGSAHIGRVIEAVMIATGGTIPTRGPDAQLYVLGEGPGLAAIRAQREASAGGR